MSISSRLSNYLDQRGAHYEVCMHEPSRTSYESARISRVSPHMVAKSVILEDDDGCLMAVVPGDRHVMLGQLGRMLGRDNLRLADEGRIAMLFDDCDRGAIPPMGMAWGLETIVDDEVESNEVVYLEGGDHESLLRMSGDQFQHLMSGARHGRFCRTWH